MDRDAECFLFDSFSLPMTMMTMAVTMMMTVAVTMMMAMVVTMKMKMKTTMIMMMEHRWSFSRRRKDVTRAALGHSTRKKKHVKKCGGSPPSATAERTNLHQRGPLLPLIHRLPIQVLKDERRAVSPTDTLSNLTGPLAENCRGRADKHHTAHHQSTELQIEAHEQIQRWIHG